MGANAAVASGGVGMSSLAHEPTDLPDGIWASLLEQAFLLMDEVERHGISQPFWTFGGGTVLMLRYRHRLSKDIDIFVPDPQYLGYVSPRLSDVAESVSKDYVEGPGYIKLLCSEGEIDVVASQNLTEPAFELWQLLGRKVRVETAAEIVAKKLWHRGDRATARDLFDLSLVIEREPQTLRQVARHLTRHAKPFVEQLHARRSILKAQFEAIETLNYQPKYDEALARAESFLNEVARDAAGLG
jgi:predicted nucleotidyltransferase component of viral defense system